jgi:hypothetical protein
MPLLEPDLAGMTVDVHLGDRLLERAIGFDAESGIRLEGLHLDLRVAHVGLI